jgi:hypothetical protein
MCVPTGDSLERHFEEVESEFSSIRLIKVVVYSELHRKFGVIVRRNIVVFLHESTVYSAALGCSASISALPQACALLLGKESSELEGGKEKVNVVSKMGEVPVTRYQTLWMKKLSALKSEYQILVQQNPEANAQLKQLLMVLGDIEDVAGHIPASVGESAEWVAIVNAAEGDGASYCKGLHGKPLFSAQYGIYTVTLHELKAVLMTSNLAGQTNLPKTTGQETTQEGSFQEVGRRKRRAINETAGTS